MTVDDQKALEKSPSSGISTETIEKVLLKGDLTELKADQRLQYYNAVCESVGLNALTRPFEYIVLNDKLVLYATKNCTDQLRFVHKISIEVTNRERIGDVYVVTARAKMPDGRTDESTGAVPLAKEDGEWTQSNSGKRFFKKNGLSKPIMGDELANAFMKAETKAKRRVTLSICGLGILDETEIDSIPSAKPAHVVDLPKAEIVEPDVISTEQAKTLFAAARQHAWSDDEVKYLIRKYGYESSKQIKLTDYDKILGELATRKQEDYSDIPL